MSFSPDGLMRQFADYPSARRYLVAFSGGMDSSVLLDALSTVCEELDVELEAIHIDHGLHPDSPRWTRHCREFCESRGIPFINISLELKIPPGESIEGCAREARYDAIGSEMASGDMVLMAHHQDDQAETLLLHLMRGSGPRGLSSMPHIRPFAQGWLARPLLGYSRDQLAAYASKRELNWIDDPSNTLLDHDRNFLRHEVIRRLKERWPSAQKSMASSVNLIQRSEQLLEDQGRVLLSRVRLPGGELSVAALQSLGHGWRCIVVREWLRQKNLPAPPRRRLDELLLQLDSREFLIAWDGVELRRYRDALFAFEPLPPHDASINVPLPLGESVKLPSNLGCFRLTGKNSERFEVRFRQGGEFLCWHGHQRTLKALFQQLGLPPWLRDRVPLIVRGDGVLCAVADYLCADSFECSVEWLRGPGWVGFGKSHPQH